jgi:ribonuclease D
MSLPFATSVRKEQINQLPLLRFEGNVHLIDSKEKVAPAIKALLNSDILGFDTEKKPTFLKGQYHYTALVQLSTGVDAFLFRISEIGVPKGLLQVLESASIIKIGIGIRDDLIALQELCKFTPAGFEDLNEIVPEMGIKKIGVRNLAAIFLNKRVSKNQQTSNWEGNVLTEGQLHYAAADAWVCYEIRRVLGENGVWAEHDQQ